MPVIMKDNVQYAYTTKGTVFHTLSNAEYEALTEEEKMNGDVYCIPDREPVINPDQLWEKVGTGTLDIGDDLTDGVNQLNSSLSGLFKVVTFPNSATITVPANGAVNITANQMNISTPAGYTPVALNAFFCNSNDVVWRSVQAQATGTSSFTVLRNVTSASKDVIVNCSLLYVKTNFIG